MRKWKRVVATLVEETNQYNLFVASLEIVTDTQPICISYSTGLISKLIDLKSEYIIDLEDTKNHELDFV